MRKITIWLFAMICSLSVVLTQSVSIDTYGVSPRGVEADSTDIFNRTYNGLYNVGIETQIYLKGTATDSLLTNPAWTITSAPSGSAVGFGASVDLDTASQVIVFEPDMAGVYTIEFSDIGASASLIIHAGTYMGIADGMCGMCHADKAAEWAETGHYWHIENGISGYLGSYYSEGCISCHTTGYDVNANNGGFDDFEFVFPDSLYPGAYDILENLYPEAMELSRVQCEACHGPGSDHFGNTSDNRMVASLRTDNCALCHDSGSYHVFPNQWALSGHANPPVRDSWYSSCRCHTPEGFIEYAEGEEVTSHGSSPFYCAMCHDPHSAETPHQVRLADTPVTLANGYVIEDGGLGKLCMNCHMTRRDAETYTNEPHSHYGPHYGVQADMISAANAVTFGQNLPSSPHLTATDNACVTCHMWDANGNTDDDGNIYDVGGHTFGVVNQAGEDNVLVCAPCHGEIESFDSKMYWDNGVADHDGDGVNEGVQEEIDGLMTILSEMLPHGEDTTAYDPHDDVDDTFTLTELKAAYNFEFVYYDHSHGIHNPAFAVALLQVSIQALLNNVVDGQIVGIDDVPNDQGRQVKVIWDKFLDDGIADDPIDIYAVKRYDEYDDTWTNVGTLPADGSDRYAFVAPTLFDSTSVSDGITTFKVLAFSEGGDVYESDPAEGYSIDNLAPAIPTGLLASSDLGTIELTWDEPVDLDFNYFAIYRDGELVGYSTEANYVDVVSSGGEYVYTIIATDINENMSSPSSPESVMAGLIGDSNGDFSINVLDVVEMVSIILGNMEATDFQFWADDVNSDGAINILDVVWTIGEILNPSVARGNMMTAADVSFGNGLITINSDGNIAGFQITLKGDFDLTSTDLPSGWEVHIDNSIILAFNMNSEEMTESVLINMNGEFVVETALIADWYENGVQAELVFVPDEYTLSNAYPNPFNPTTTFEYGLPINSNVKIMVYDVLGRNVAELVNGYQTAGDKKVTWTTDGLPSGIYIVKMSAKGFEKTKKVMLVK